MILNFLNTRIAGRIRFGYDVGRGYIKGVEELDSAIEMIAGDNAKTKSKLRRMSDKSKSQIMRDLGILQRSYPGRIRAGAPVPTRSMSSKELMENIDFFTTGMSGPRATPCTVLVLSGVGVACRTDIPETIQMARDRGIDHVVLHVGGENLSNINVQQFDGLVDTLVVPVQPESVALADVVRVIRDAHAAKLSVSANTVLTANALAGLTRSARTIGRASPDSVTYTYPFPINGNESTSAPAPPRVMSALRPALQVLERAGIHARIKGLPACHLGADGHRLGKTSNRYYVDADHQCAEAMMFFPDVVRFFKGEACRFCTMDGECDGFFATYLRRPGFPALHPIEKS